MTTTLFPGRLHTSIPTPAIRDGRLQLISAGPNLWRVQDRPGHILGHIHASDGPMGVAYRAQRWMPRLSAFCALGDFWDADDAVAALRYS